MAEALAIATEQWIITLGKRGVIPRAFVAITDDGRQFTVLLNGLPLDHVRRRDFLIWLCRKLNTDAYSYTTHAMTEENKEQLLIYTSSYTRNISLILDVIRTSDEIIGYSRAFYKGEAARVDDQDQFIFFGLNRSCSTLTNVSEFEKIWSAIEDNVLCTNAPRLH